MAAARSSRGARMSSHGVVDSNGLKVQVQNLDRTTQELWTKYDDINKQISGFGKPNLQVIISAVVATFTILGFILGFAVKPLIDDIEEGKHADRRWQEEVKRNYVRVELYDEQVLSMKKQIDLTRESLAELRKEVASRDQMLALSRRVDVLDNSSATRDQMLEVAKRADETAKVIGGLYPLDKVIQGLENAQRSLQSRIDILSSTAPVVPVPSSGRGTNAN
jgi:uncharacterized coiled-coil DUF342 family protein